MIKLIHLLSAEGWHTRSSGALGNTTGSSICEEDKLELALDLIKRAREKKVNFLLPVDNVIGREYKEDTVYMRIYSDSIPDGWMGTLISVLLLRSFTQRRFRVPEQWYGTDRWGSQNGKILLPEHVQ